MMCWKKTMCSLDLRVTMTVMATCNYCTGCVTTLKRSGTDKGLAQFDLGVGIQAGEEPCEGKLSRTVLKADGSL
jgi:hypothetical protein